MSLATPLAAQEIFAQEKQAEPKEEVITLEPITVTATPLEAEEQHIAQPVEVLRGERLRRRQALTIGETLAREPGISASDFGQGASRPIIRGLGGSRVRLLEGGIGSMDVSNLSPDHAVSIDPLQASQIEILKGPATLLYGSGAVGGIVNKSSIGSQPGCRMHRAWTRIFASIARPTNAREEARWKPASAISPSTWTG
ncbi:MAG: TonB-dependent receptor plug domain-containing protein [Gammaproteobacteria bacterium]